MLIVVEHDFESDVGEMRAIMVKYMAGFVIGLLKRLGQCISLGFLLVMRHKHKMNNPVVGYGQFLDGVL